MTDFIERIHLKEKAEENLYFAKLDRKLIRAIHKKRAETVTSKERDQSYDIRLQEEQH